MPTILALYGSPRRHGNTATLLDHAVSGALSEGAAVDKVILRDLTMSPCLEIYGCKETGRCAIKDDFQKVYDQLENADGIILASPIFFYAVSAHTKILMDRCQSLWVRKHWLEKSVQQGENLPRKGLFISVGATRGKKLFDGAVLSVRYFFEAIDTQLWSTLLYRKLDFAGDVDRHPEYLEEARQAGRQLASALAGDNTKR